MQGWRDTGAGQERPRLLGPDQAQAAVLILASCLVKQAGGSPPLQLCRAAVIVRWLGYHGRTDVLLLLLLLLLLAAGGWRLAAGESCVQSRGGGRAGSVHDLRQDGLGMACLSHVLDRSHSQPDGP